MSLIVKELEERILVLDGAMGTMIQGYEFDEEDFRGDLVINKTNSLKGNNDILSITRPDVIKSIHYDYLLHGADIIETNTLNSNKISQVKYGTQKYVYEMNKQSASLAKQAVKEYMSIYPSTPKFVAGSIGPTNKMGSFSKEISKPFSREVIFDELCEAYEEQVRGLIKGGVDLLILETMIDGINGKAAIVGAKNVFEQLKVKYPIIVSGTINNKSGRILSGQTIESFLWSVKSEDVLAVGMNCSFCDRELMSFTKNISKEFDCFISLYPNAGFRNAHGKFEQGPEEMAYILTDIINEGHVNIIGGCCGTTPQYIEAISKLVKGKRPRKIFKKQR